MGEGLVNHGDKLLCPRVGLEEKKRGWIGFHHHVHCNCNGWIWEQDSEEKYDTV